jgi:hypothetical protein
MKDLAALIPLAMVSLLIGVMAFIAWRQDHPKTKHP